MRSFLRDLPKPVLDVRAWQLGTALLVATGCDPFSGTEEIAPIDDGGEDGGEDGGDGYTCGPQGCDGGDCGGEEYYGDDGWDEGEYDDEGGDEAGDEGMEEGCALDCGPEAVCINDTCVGLTMIPACDDMALVHSSPMAVSGPALALALMQADEDSEPELAVALEGSIELFLGDGEPVSSVLSELPGVMAAADLDGDGLDELLVSPADDASLQVHRNLGDGLLPLGDVVAAPRYGELRTHDFDGDGAMDVVGRVADSGATQLLTGDGDFHLSSPFGIDPELAVAQIAVAEDDDGAATLVLGSGAGLNAWSGADGEPFDPISAELASYPYAIEGWDVEVARYDDDANPDIVSAARQGADYVVVAHVQFAGEYPSASARFGIEGVANAGDEAHLDVADFGLGVERPVLWGSAGVIAVLDGCWEPLSDAPVLSLESGDLDGDGRDEVYLGHPGGLTRVDVELIEE